MKKQSVFLKLTSLALVVMLLTSLNLQKLHAQTVTITGDGCFGGGNRIRLSSSQVGVTYYLMSGNDEYLEIINGTGNPIEFTESGIGDHYFIEKNTTSTNVYIGTLRVPNIPMCTRGDATVCIGANTGSVSVLIPPQYWESSTNGFVTATRINSTALSLPYTNLSQTTQFRVVYGIGWQPSTPATITVMPCTVSGTVSGAATVCKGVNSGSVSVSGYSGSIVRWEASVDGFVSLSPIASTSATLPYSSLTNTIQFRAVFSSGGVSPAVTITVVSAASIVTAGSTSVCSGANGGTVSMSGFTGNVLAWSASTDNFVTSTNIASQDATLTYKNLTQTTQYRATVKAGNCVQAVSVATVSVISSAKPAITGYTNIVCAGTPVTLSSSCGAGSTVWSTGQKTNSITLNSNIIEERTISVKCTGGTCDSDQAAVTVQWGKISPTILDVARSQNNSVATTNAPISAWRSVTPSNAVPLFQSTAASRTRFNTEEYSGPRFWTIDAKTCDASRVKSLSFLLYMLDNQTNAVVRSFNTVENAAPYLMFGNANQYTKLYTLNDPLFGFSSPGDNLGNGFPAGKYNLKIKAMTELGTEYGPRPSTTTRYEAGAVVYEQEFFFQIAPAATAARVAALEPSIESQQMLTVSPNPVRESLNISINHMKGQEVALYFTDLTGRVVIQKSIKPITDRHIESFDVTNQRVGSYFVQAIGETKKMTLKVMKIE